MGDSTPDASPVSLQDKISLSEGEVIQSHSSEKAAQFIKNLSGTPGSELVGFTVENSNIGILRFEVSAASAMAEGQVVFVRLAALKFLRNIAVLD
jgi:hypothetical protein